MNNNDLRKIAKVKFLEPKLSLTVAANSVLEARDTSQLM